jgi:predicted CopG family antitoxin
MNTQKMMAIRTKVYADLTRFKGKVTEKDGVNHSYSDVIAILLKQKKELK